MNYANIYNNLVLRGKERVVEGYVEKHHIVPKCMGGSDDPDNLVELTPEEHYLAHQLLVKMYPYNNSLIYAAALMVGNRETNKTYGWIRRKISKARKGVPLSEEHKKKLSEKHHRTATAGSFKPGRVVSDEERKIKSEKLTGIVRSEETKEKIRQANLGIKKDPSVGKKISEKLKGRAKPMNTVECPHCGKEGGKSLMTRYHFDNCRMKVVV